MGSRIPGRIIAPLALIAVGLALVVVFSVSTGSDGATSTTSSTSTAAPGTGAAGGASKTKPKLYVIKRGDTLVTIANKNGVTVARIQALNPDVDPQALVPGQSIKIGP